MKKLLEPALAGAALLVLAAGCGGGGGAGGTGGGGGLPPPVLVITATVLPNGVMGRAYLFTVPTTGGTGALTFTIVAGALPAGLTLQSVTGAITGAPSGPLGTSNVTVMVADSGTPRQQVSQQLTITVTEPLVFAPAALPDTRIGLGYLQTLTATGGTAPYRFAIVAGTLPAGLFLGSGGTITGTALEHAANQTLTVRVTDSSEPVLTDAQVLTIGVVLEITTTSLQSATAWFSWGQHLMARGGQPPYADWARTAGTMPAGIGDPNPVTGFMQGTPEPVCATTTSMFTVRVSDSAMPPASATRPLSLSVNPRTVTLDTQPLPNGIVGVPYSGFVRALYGVPPYRYTTEGTLPSMLGPIDSLTGEIAGTPNVVETRYFTTFAEDTCGVRIMQAAAITVSPLVTGRNDSIATASSLGNGEFAASISPSGHPNSVLAPDRDYYRITTTSASTVSVTALVTGIQSPLDPVMEFVDENGVRLNNCVEPAYTSACVNDDIVPGNQLDSFLRIRVSGATSFYVHVMDYRGDARPDLRYMLQIYGVN